MAANDLESEVNNFNNSLWLFTEKTLVMIDKTFAGIGVYTERINFRNHRSPTCGLNNNIITACKAEQNMLSAFVLFESAFFQTGVYLIDFDFLNG